MRWLTTGCLAVILGCGQGGFPPGNDGGTMTDQAECMQNSDCKPEEACFHEACSFCKINFTQTLLAEDRTITHAKPIILEWNAEAASESDQCSLSLVRLRFEFIIKRASRIVPLFVLTDLGKGMHMKGFIVDPFSATGEQYIVHAEWEGRLPVPAVGVQQLGIFCDNCRGNEADELTIAARLQTDYFWSRADNAILSGQHDSIVQITRFSDK